MLLSAAARRRCTRCSRGPTVVPARPQPRLLVPGVVVCQGRGVVGRGRGEVAGAMGEPGSQLPLECTHAVACGRPRQTATSQACAAADWILNEPASPYEDVEQNCRTWRPTSYRSTLRRAHGVRTLGTLAAAAHGAAIPRAQPVAGNGAILDSLLEAAAASLEPQRFHILDLKNTLTFCMQWPTRLEALAARSASADDTSHLLITTVMSAAPTAAVQPRFYLAV
ncbi:hypothetical protein BS78_08G123900 [Paspalum vaginatum]|nr:hypothetical protein BS78_08G123900 [Paspalum vaginatum]